MAGSDRSFEILGIKKVVVDLDDYDSLVFETTGAKGFVRLDDSRALDLGITIVYPEADFPTGESIPARVFNPETGLEGDVYFSDAIYEPYLLLAARRQLDRLNGDDTGDPEGVLGMELKDVMAELKSGKNGWGIPWWVTNSPLSVLGGEGSGNFGHKGRPGETGGSAPGNGAGGGAQPKQEAPKKAVIGSGYTHYHSYWEHTGADGKLTPSRQKLHQEIINKTLAGATAQKNPRYIMFGGGTASGKSHLMKSGKVSDILPADAVSIDSDKIKGELPEYKQRILEGDKSAAQYVHEESSLIAKAAEREAKERQYTTILDGTGDTSVERIRRKIDEARAKGYSADAVYVTVPLELALARAASREAKTGRHVPREIIESIHAKVSQIFPKVASEFDNVRLYDTSGEEPILIASGTRGKELTIHDKMRYGTFLAKAKVGPHTNVAEKDLSVEDIGTIMSAAVQGDPCPTEFLPGGQKVWDVTRRDMKTLPKGHFIDIPFEIPDGGAGLDMYGEDVSPKSNFKALSSSIGNKEQG